MKKFIINESQLKLLLEQTSSEDQECINKLTDNNGEKYIIRKASEESSNIDKCLKKPTLKCVNDLLSNKFSGLVSPKFINGQCFIEIESTNKRSRGVAKHYLTFFPDKWVGYVFTFPNKYKGGQDRTVYYGKYDCDGSNITYSDMKFYLLSDENGNKTEVSKDKKIPLYDDNGKDLGFDLKVDLVGDGKQIPSNGDILNDIINKYFK